MTTSIISTPASVAGQLALIEITEPGLDCVERALAGYLAGYSGATLVGYRLDLRQWVEWITNLHIDVLAAERAHIELYARCCESDGKARSTIGRRLSTICGFYRYCEQQRIIDRNPAAPSRTTNRPRLGWTATNSAPSSSEPACPAAATMPSHHCSR